METRCKLCNRKLKNWESIQRGIGPTCERKYLDNIYKTQQISIEELLQKKGEIQWQDLKNKD